MKLAVVIIWGAIYAATSLPAKAGCHHYSVWHFNFPQQCGGLYLRAHHHAAMVVPASVSPPVPARDPDMPLPDMSADWSDFNTSLSQPDQFRLLEEVQHLKAIRQLTQQGN